MERSLNYISTPLNLAPVESVDRFLRPVPQVPLLLSSLEVSLHFKVLKKIHAVLEVPDQRAQEANKDFGHSCPLCEEGFAYPHDLRPMNLTMRDKITMTRRNADDMMNAEARQNDSDMSYGSLPRSLYRHPLTPKT